jgi:hypothetical protein
MEVFVTMAFGVARGYISLAGLPTPIFRLFFLASFSMPGHGFLYKKEFSDLLFRRQTRHGDTLVDRRAQKIHHL